MASASGQILKNAEGSEKHLSAFEVNCVDATGFLPSPWGSFVDEEGGRGAEPVSNRCVTEPLN